MLIDNTKCKIVEHFDQIIKVPDSFVVTKNKIGTGHGEGKLYIASKSEMRQFYGGEGFEASCFMLRSDLLTFLENAKVEYLHPTQGYIAKDCFAKLWEERVRVTESLPEIIRFVVRDQTQIQGPRGYVNSPDQGFQLIRQLSLPTMSYLQTMEIEDPSGARSYYWKLFADFDAMAEKQPYALIYGTKKDSEGCVQLSKRQENIAKARVGQGKYREALMEECPFCPITMVNDERLLIASHIKPWAVCDNRERLDPKNGFMLSPLYDRLFDKGLITFTDDRRMLVSNWLSPKNVERLKLVNNKFIQHLPIDEARCKYLAYHRSTVFKG